MTHKLLPPIRLLPAIAVLFLIVPLAGAQVLKPGLQPGLTRAPDSARKISLDEAVRMAQQNAPEAIQAEGGERTSKAARAAAIGAILPSASLNMGRVIQFGGGQTRINQNGETVAITAAPTNSTGLTLNMTLFDGGQRLYFDRQLMLAGLPLLIDFKVEGFVALPAELLFEHGLAVRLEE